MLSLSACVLLTAPFAAGAQTEPIIVEAESATVSSAYSVGTQDGATYVTIVNDSPGFGPPATADGALIYSVTFPEAGNYELYARFRVGPGGGSDDSFYVGNGFGDKVGTGEWVLVNQVDGGGLHRARRHRSQWRSGDDQCFQMVQADGLRRPSDLDRACRQSHANVFCRRARDRQLHRQVCVRSPGLVVHGQQSGHRLCRHRHSAAAASAALHSARTAASRPVKPKFLGSAHSPAQTRELRRVLEPGHAGERRQVGHGREARAM